MDDLKFDPELVCRGLVIDKELGNLIKVDRFGYVRRAMHGSRRLAQDEVVAIYGRTVVNLREGSRYEFVNTLFSCSEGCLYAQLVDKFDDGRLKDESVEPFDCDRVNDYAKLHHAVSRALFRAHVQGDLKAEVVKNPEAFVRLDPDLAQTLLDQQSAGKALVLITNSDWWYTEAMMSFIIDRYLEPGKTGKTWRSLFDIVVVSSSKPAFFSQKMPLYELADPTQGLMRQTFELRQGGLYSGGAVTGRVMCARVACARSWRARTRVTLALRIRTGPLMLVALPHRPTTAAARVLPKGSARMVEKLFRCSPDKMLYVGDHIFTDLTAAKATMRWRTALVVQELEKEIEAQQAEREQYDTLEHLLGELDSCRARINRIRNIQGKRDPDPGELRELDELQATSDALAARLAPLLFNEGATFNPYWGHISRAGFSDKSHLMRQIEKYADVYTSRVSNFLVHTPHASFRGFRQALAHDSCF